MPRQYSVSVENIKVEKSWIEKIQVYNQGGFSIMKKITKKSGSYLPILLASLFLLMVGFQNCNENNTSSPSIVSEPTGSTKNPSTTTTTTSTTLSIPAIEIQALSQDIASDHFDVDTKVDLLLVAPESQAQRRVFREYRRFEWIIIKEDLKNLDSTPSTSEDNNPSIPVNRDDPKKITTEPRYSWTFDEVGVYSISAVPKNSKDQKLKAVHKTLIIGKCNSSPPVEIFLRMRDSENVDLPQQDKKSVFYVESGQRQAIDKVLWLIKHNGLKLESQSASPPKAANVLATVKHNSVAKTLKVADLDVDENGELTATWGNFSGDVTVKFFAQFRGESCITHRRQNHTVVGRDDIPKPLIHVRLVDSKNPQNVSLASKLDRFDAYKYKKRQEETFELNENLQVKTRFYADECLYAPPGSGVIPWRSCDQLADDSSIHQVLTADWSENDKTASCEDQPFVQFRVTNQKTDSQPKSKINYHMFYKYCPLPLTNNDCYFVENNEKLETSHYRCVFVRDIPHDLEEKPSKTWNWNCSKRNCKFRHVINQQAPPDNKTYYSISEYNPFAERQPFTNVKTDTQRSGASGKYWIHIQAQDENSNQSTIHATSAILSASPTVVTTTTTTTSSPPPTVMTPTTTTVQQE